MNKDKFLVKDGNRAEWGVPEGYPYSETSETVIADSLVINGFTYHTDSGFYMASNAAIMQALRSYPDFDEMLLIGKPFVIIWDGNAYDCIFNLSIGGFGNFSLLNSEYPDNGVPFCVIDNYVITKEVSESHTVDIKIVKETVYPLDKKFLPVGLEVVFEYYNGSFSAPRDITFDDLNNAYLNKELITAKLLNANAGVTTDSYYVGSYDGDFAFLVYAISEDVSGVHIFTCSSENGWKERRFSMAPAAAVANAAGDTPTAAEFNALLNSLRYVGILAT